MSIFVSGTVTRRFFLYNTACEVSLCHYEGDATRTLDECEQIAHEVQKRLDVFDPASELSRLNDGYIPARPYRISEPLFLFLRELASFSQQSFGAYDATLGALMSLWRFTAADPAVPTQEAIEDALFHTGYKYLAFDAEACAVTVLRPGIRLDAGGAGKGYAVSLVAEHLRSCAVQSASVNFGGNLYVLGERRAPGQSARPWKIAIQAPWRPKGENIGHVSLADLGIATSGGYERHFTLDGKVYHHILNPATGYPVQNEIQSISIVSDRPLMTDLMSTAFFVLGPERGDELARALRADMTLEYVLIKEHEVLVSAGLMKRYHPAADKNIPIRSVRT